MDPSVVQPIASGRVTSSYEWERSRVMPLLAISTPSTMLMLLGGAALILYIAGRFAIGSMPAHMDRSGTRAVIAIVPVLAISIIAIIMDRVTIALHLPIACAAAALTFGLAAIITGRPMPHGAPTNHAWSLLVPAVAMLLIASLGGRIDFTVLIALLMYGLLALTSWSEDPVEVEMGVENAATSPTSPQLAIGLWVLGLVAACVAGVLAMYGADHLDAVRSRSSDGLVAVFLLAPAIVVPFFFEMLPPCRSIGWGGSVSSLLKFSLLCLCCVLPVAAITAGIAPRISSQYHFLTASAATQPTTVPTHVPATTDVITFPSLPIIASRADILVLIGVSMLLIPMSAGWLKAGKIEALALLLCYVLYLLLVMTSSL